LSRRTTASPRARRSTPSRAGADLLALSSVPPHRTRKLAPAPRQRSVLREVIDTLDDTVQGVVERGRRGSFDDRDPAFIRSQLRWLPPLADIYFRGEVRDNRWSASAATRRCSSPVTDGAWRAPCGSNGSASRPCRW
jgi:hypothetical protein